MKISPNQIKELRSKTGARMQDCVEALKEAQNDHERAVEILRKRNKVRSKMRSGREVAVGVLFGLTDEKNEKGVLLGLGCETEFVAREQGFIALGQRLAQLALEHGPSSAQALLALPIDGAKLIDHLQEYAGTVGEKVDIVAYERCQAATVCCYIHTGNRIGSLMGLNQSHQLDVAKNLCLQVVANPALVIEPEAFPAALVEKERAIVESQVATENKPPHILKMIVENKIKRFKEEQSLLTQPYFKEPAKRVADYLNSVTPSLKVVQFKRVQI